MKIWIECRQNLEDDGFHYYHLWSGATKRTGIGRYVCTTWLAFLLPGFQLPEPGELAELEVNHLETWEMK